MIVTRATGRWGSTPRNLILYLSLVAVFLLALIQLQSASVQAAVCPTQCDLSSLIPTDGSRRILGPAGATITVNSSVLLSVTGKSMQVTTPQPTWGPGTVLVLYQATGATVETKDPTSRTFGRVLSFGNAGNWDVVVVESVISPAWTTRTQFSLVCAPVNTYTNFEGVAVEAIIADEVELLDGVTVTATGWRATTDPNPVIPIIANTLTLGAGASISAKGKGFLGGAVAGSKEALLCTDCAADCKQFDYNYNDSTWGGRRGGSIASQEIDFDPIRTTSSFGRGAVANGGGGGNNHNAPGGGGANGWRSRAGTAVPWTGQGIMNPAFTNIWTLEGITQLADSSGGGRGGYSFSEEVRDPKVDPPGDCVWQGNARLNNGGLGGRPLRKFVGGDVYSKLFLGGGGGAGHNNDWLAGAGGNGGGFIVLITNRIIGGTTNLITADGDDGEDSKVSLTVPFDGPGGAGAGGSIFLAAYDVYDTDIQITARGGKGGNNMAAVTVEAEGAGGGGGGGVVAFVVNGDALRAAGVTAFACAGPGVSVAGGQNGIQQGQEFFLDFPPNGATSGAGGQCLSAPISIPCLTSRSPSPSKGAPKSKSRSPKPSSLRSPSSTDSSLPSPSASLKAGTTTNIVGSSAPGGSTSSGSNPTGVPPSTATGTTTGRPNTGTTGQNPLPEVEETSTTSRRRSTTGQRKRNRGTTGRDDDSSASTLCKTTIFLTILVFLFHLIAL